MKNQDISNSTKTPQELVHIKHTISARQYKYWFLILKACKDLMESGSEKDENGFYYVSIDSIKKRMGYEPVKKELKTDLEALRKEPIIINYLEKDKQPATHGMGFISEWKVTSTQIAFKLPSFIENVLRGNLEAKQMFLLLNWDIFNSFSGKYEAIIYKLCRDYVGWGHTPYMSIEEYRDYIGLKDSEYKDFKALNRRTISEPIKNINNNEMSDIIVGVEFRTEGKKVLGLFFYTEYKYVKPIDIARPDSNNSFDKSLITIPISKQIEYLQKYSEDQIKAIIDRANDYIDKLKADGKKASVGAIYNKAFAESWGLDNWEAEQKAKAEAEEKKRQAKAEREAKKQAEKEAKEREEQEKAERERCFAVFEALPIEEQEAILDEVEAETMPFMANLFKKDRKNGLKPYRKPPHYFALIRIMQAKNL